MNTWALFVSLLALTVLIFIANYEATRVGCQPEPNVPEDYCVSCRCNVKLRYPNPRGKAEPSCSVVFTLRSYEPGESPTYSTTKITRDGLKFSACDAALICDTGSEADLSCSNKPDPAYKTVVTSRNKCSIRCDRTSPQSSLFGPPVPGNKITRVSCDIWKRQPQKNKQGLVPADQLDFLAFGSQWQRGSGFTAFLPVRYSQQQPEDEDNGLILTETAWWKPVGGDAGFDEGVLTVTNGEAIVSSLCTGDTVQLSRPGTFTLPSCYGDSLGRWQGAYARRMPKGVLTPVTVTLDLRREGRLLTGELTTPEGTFKIVSFSQAGSSIELKASATIGGKQVDIVLYGVPGKGEIVFDGREGTPGERSRKIIGFVRRLYIADYGLLPAVVNQPYLYKLFAFSPTGKPVTFSLKEGKLPGGILLDSQTGVLKGTPTELGNFNVRIAVSDANGNTFEQPFTLTVKKIVLAMPALPDAIVGQPFSAKLQAVGGSPPYKYTAGMPAGLTLDPNNGEISGTSTRENEGTVTVFITDSRNIQELVRLTFKVRGTTIMTSHFLPEAKIGSPYRAQFQAIGNKLPIAWSIGRVEPGEIGLSIDPQTGVLSGTPTQTGTFMLQVFARANDSHMRDFALTISP